MHAQPQPETAVAIKVALHHQEVCRRALLECEETPEQLVAAAGDYLDATDALYASQTNVPRVPG
jgi:hypothetical protein